MSDWEKHKLSDIVDIISGGTPKTTNPDYWGGLIPWLSIADFNKGLRWVSSAEKTITQDGLDNSATSLLEPHDTIISARGTVGAIAQLAIPMAFNQSCYGIRAKRDIADSDYVYYAFQIAVQQLKQVAHGAVFDTITKETFSIIEVPVPPLSEQKTIAYILGTLDDKIELNRRMNETLEGIARALFKSWFIDFDPVRAKAEGRQPFGMNEETAALFPSEFEDSELGEIPKGWMVKPLDEVAEFLNGLAMQKYPATSEDSLPVIKIAELNRGINESTSRASTDIPSEYVVENGDVLFSWSGSLELKIWCGGRGALNQHLFKVTSEEYPKWFYYHWIEFYLESFRQIAAGKATTMGHIQRYHLTEAVTVIPTQDVMEKANIIMDSLIEQFININKNIWILQSIRDELLPKLISGDIRVDPSRFGFGQEGEKVGEV